MFPENQGGQKGLYTQDLFTKAALNFMSINKPDQFNQHRPFFLYLAYTIPHACVSIALQGRATKAGGDVI